jgi:hypothetical protein
MFDGIGTFFLFKSPYTLTDAQNARMCLTTKCAFSNVHLSVLPVCRIVDPLSLFALESSLGSTMLCTSSVTIFFLLFGCN